MKDLDKIIEAAEEFALQHVRNQSENITEDKIISNFSSSLKPQDYVDFLINEYKARRVEINNKFLNELSSLSIEELKRRAARIVKENTLQKKFYMAFLFKYERLLTQDSEDGGKSLSELRERLTAMTMEELKKNYEKINGEGISVKNTVKSVNSCNSDLIALLNFFDRQAKSSAQSYYKEIMEQAERVSNSDVKWLKERYSVQELEIARNLLYGSDILSGLAKEEVERGNEKSKNSSYLDSLIMDCIQPMLEDLPLKGEDAIEKAYLVNYLASFFHLNLPLFKDFIYKDIENPTLAKFSIRKALEFMPIADLEHSYRYIQNFKKLVNQIESPGLSGESKQ